MLTCNWILEQYYAVLNRSKTFHLLGDVWGLINLLWTVMYMCEESELCAIWKNPLKKTALEQISMYQIWLMKWDSFIGKPNKIPREDLYTNTSTQPIGRQSKKRKHSDKKWQDNSNKWCGDNATYK